jgi:hypothetical protein
MSSAPTRTELALELLRMAAADQGKQCCADTDGEMVCVIVKGHKGEHRYELVSSVIPFE